MYFDINGPDFIRVQRQLQGRSGDALDPDVMFSGNYEDGQGYFYQVAVDAVGIANGKSYSINLSPSFVHAPIIFGILRLTRATVQNGGTVFNSGEYVTPCGYRYQNFNQLPSYDYAFQYSVSRSVITVGVTDMTGVATFLVLDT